MAVSPATRRWRYILLGTFILVPLVNYLPVIFAESPGERFADDTETRVDAAGYAFSIWGLIFLGMLLFAALQLRNEEDTPELRRAYKFLTAAGWASIAFVPISLYAGELLGWVDLIWHLLALIGAYVALRAHSRRVGEPAYAWTYFAPSVYLGWISAATVIATALALDALGVSFAQPTAVTIALGLVWILTLLGLWLGRRGRDGVYALTVAWALVGIAVEQSDAAMVFYGAVAGAVLTGLAGGYWLRRGGWGAAGIPVGAGDG